MNNKGFRRKLIATLVAGAALLAQPAWSEQYAANFKGTDIQEFINIVGKNLNKTIIVDPTIRGKINVRSYDLLNDEQYSSSSLMCCRYTATLWSKWITTLSR